MSEENVKRSLRVYALAERKPQPKPRPSQSTKSLSTRVRRKFRAMGLELIVGVDIETDDYTDLDRLIATQSGAEFPTVERGENFAGHHC